MNLDSFLRDVPDFPKPGIVFKDISPLLASHEALEYTIDTMAERAADLGVQRVAGVESRGFLFGVPLALRLGVGFTPIRKPGKLPAKSTGIEYALEYGVDRLEIHNDGLQPGDAVLVVDDVLATGGTAQAACELVELIGGKVVGCLFLLELAFLNGREKLPGRNIISLLRND